MKTTVLKRILSFILCLTLSASLLPVNVLAEEATVDASALSMEGTNSVGDLLVNTLTTVEGDMTDTCRVTDIQLTGTTAAVKYQSDRAAEVVVAVYDEDTMRMLGFGAASAAAEETVASVEIDIDAMPEYFVAVAYLLEEETHIPLGEQYVSRYYTSEFQAFLDTTVDSYDSDRVLNLDDDTTTNFVVFSENTILVKEESGINEITDNGDGTYTIENADERFLALQPGDSFGYTYASGEVLVVVAASVEVNGSHVVITQETDADLADVFEYVKIDVKANGANAQVDVSGAGSGVDYEGRVALDGAGIEEEAFEYTDTFNVNTSVGAVTVTGSVEYSAVLTGCVYVSPGWEYASLSLKYQSVVSLKISDKLLELELPLAEMEEPVAPFVVFRLSLALVAEAEAAVTGSVSYGGVVGFSYDSDVGYTDIGEAPSISSKVEIGGTAFYGLQVKATLSIMLEEIANVALTARNGYEESLKHLIWTSEQKEYQHDCQVCFDGDVYRVETISRSVSFLNNAPVRESKLTTDKEKTRDYYYSVDRDEFGEGTCPYIRYLVTVTVQDEYGNPFPGEEIRGTGLAEKPLTDENGTASFYLPNGEYTLGVLRNTYSGEKAVTVMDGAKKGVKIYIVMAEVVESGTCGEALVWTMYDNGTLYITGNGAMEDYPFGPPWSDYRSDIKTVVVLDGVTRIGNSAFSSCGNLERVELPGGLTEIGSGAFQNCGELAELELPENLVSIGSYAFCGCDGLTAVEIPVGVTELKSQVFASCDSLVSVSVPAEVTSIDISAFQDCFALETMEVDEGNAVYCSRDGMLLTKDMSTLVYCCGGKTGICTIPDGVTDIGQKAFQECGKLTKVVIPDGMTGIGQAAFSGCKSIMEVEFHENVTSIADSAFYAAGIEKLVLPENLQSIGAYAFAYSDLREIVVPEQVTSIGEYAFAESKLETVAILAPLETFPEYAFYNCVELTAADLPDNMKTIGAHAFSGCLKLDSIHFPKQLITIGYEAFAFCEKLTYIELPNELEEVGGSAFARCTGLQEIRFPDGVVLGEGILLGCTALTAVRLPDSDQSSLPGMMFSECSSLREITIPDSMTFIGEWAFKACTGLEKIYLPAELQSVQRYAFQNCYNLTDVYFGGTEEQWAAVDISQYQNDFLSAATIHYQATGLDGVLDGTMESVVVPESGLEEERVPETEAYPEVKEVPGETEQPTEEETTAAEEIPTEEIPAEDELQPAANLLAAMSMGWSGNMPAATLLAAYNGSVSYDSDGSVQVTLYGLVPGEQYFLQVTENGTEDILYIGQSAAGETGSLTVTCRLREECYDVSAQVFGPSENLAWGAFALLSGADGTGTLLLSYNDEFLLEGEDFDLYIRENGNGTAAVTAVGRGEYGGSLAAELYAVFYDLTGGENGPVGQVQLSGQSLVITAEEPIREGWIFRGWASAADAVAEYISGDTYTGSGGVLYAVWASEGYDVNFDGFTDARDVTQILRYANEMPSLFGTADEETESARFAAADGNGDGVVNEEDALVVLTFITGGHR